MKKKNLLFNFLLILLFTGVALWWALHDKFSEVMGLLSNIKWYWFVAIFLYGAAYNLTIGCIYKVLGRKIKKNYSYREGVSVAFVGAFFAGITPSSTGGQIGQIYVLKHQGIKLSDGASILWIDFIIYQSVMVVYTTILMFLRFNYYYTEQSSFFILVLIGYVINSAVIVLLFTMAIFPKLYQILSGKVVHLLGRLHIFKNPEQVKESWNIQLESFTKEIKAIRHMKKMIVKCILLNILRLTILYTLPMFVALTMEIPVSMGMLLDIITMSAFVSVANAFIPIPGASGGTEAAFVLIFSTMFTQVEANSIMILWRFATYHFIVLIGGIIFAILKNKYDRQKANDVDIQDYIESEQEVIV